MKKSGRSCPSSWRYPPEGFRHSLRMQVTYMSDIPDEDILMARWSHKHLAHLANLGRFGTHCLLITPAGCTGRLGSLVTEVDLGEHPVIDTDEACLLKAGKKCGRCIEACPVDALAQDGFERQTCWDRPNENRDVLDYFSDLPETTDVCGKCSALIPCSFLNPVAKLE